MKVAIIDYQAGNLRNVQKTIEKFSCVAQIVRSGEELRNFDSIVLPGVGSYCHGMKKLIENNFKFHIREEVLKKKKPFLGICLGMQLIGSKGEEGGSCEGLNLLPFNVESLDSKNLKIPHVGWNNVRQRKNSSLFENIPNDSDFYFVHSYYVTDIQEDLVSGLCNYGDNFVAAIEKNNIYGTQFHPEKSQKYGLQMIQNFLKISNF